MSAALAYRLKFGFGAGPTDTLDQVTGVLALDLGWLVPVWIACLVLQDAYPPAPVRAGNGRVQDASHRLGDGGP